MLTSARGGATSPSAAAFSWPPFLLLPIQPAILIYLAHAQTPGGWAGTTAPLGWPGRQENFWAEGGNRTSPRRVRGAEGAPELCFSGVRKEQEQGVAWCTRLESRAGAGKEGCGLQDRLGASCAPAAEQHLGLRQLTSVAPLPVGTMTNVSDKPPE